MDYNSLKKDELVALVKEQKHLSQAVEAKDKEIAALNEEVKELKQTIKHDMVPKERYESAVEAIKNSVPKNKFEEVSNKLAEFEGSMTKEQLEKFLERVEKERRDILKTAMTYKTSFEDVLRVFKVNLDMAITTNELLSERVEQSKKN